MEVTAQKEGDYRIISIEGRMDASNASEFETVVNQEIDNGTKKIIVDLSKLEYISSAGLRSMLLLAKGMQKSGGSCVICALRNVVLEVFKISGFLNIFKVFETVEGAMQA